MKMRKNIAILATVATMIFSGCGDDRSHPDEENVISKTPMSPIASLSVDKNATTGYTECDDKDNNNSTLLFRWFDASDVLVFDASKSKDMDSVGSGALSYDWIVKNEDNTTMSDGCIDKNVTGSKLIIKICNEADDREEEKFSVRLNIKDDDNQTATTKTTVTIY
jgi:hypothetical protein